MDSPNTLEKPWYMTERKNFLLDILYYPIKYFLKAYYKEHFEGLENLAKLKGKPAILIAEHVRLIDIPVDDVLLKDTKDEFGYYLMKPSLPKWLFEPGGGIYVIRGKDIKNKKNPKKKALLERRRDIIKSYVYEKILPYILRKNETIVIYPEGTRKGLGSETTIPRSVLERILEIQKKTGIDITFAVLGRQYEDVCMPRTEHKVRVSKPFQVDDIGKLEQKSKIFSINKLILFKNL